MADSYEVISIDERKRLGESGGVEVYYIARGKTKAGTLFSVELSESQMDPATAQVIIAEKAQRLDKIKNL